MQCTLTFALALALALACPGQDMQTDHNGLAARLSYHLGNGVTTVTDAI